MNINEKITKILYKHLDNIEQYLSEEKGYVYVWCKHIIKNIGSITITVDIQKRQVKIETSQLEINNMQDIINLKTEISKVERICYKIETLFENMICDECGCQHENCRCGYCTYCDYPQLECKCFN